jgi:hypothetical protein
MAIVTSYDWTSDTWTHHNDNPARQAWREAVAEIAGKAKATLPECNGRVDSAVKIVLNGDVELLVDGTAKVASQSNGTTKYFVVNGECSCKDYPKAPSNWCKYRIAFGLAKRANTLAKQRLAQLDSNSNGTAQLPTEQPQVQVEPVIPPVEAATQPEPVTPIVELPTQSEAAVSPVAHTEAPASVNCYVTLAGRQVQVTLRDSDEERLLKRLETLLERFPVEEEKEQQT